MAFAAIAAVVTAEAVTVGMALAAVAEIGTVMTVVGAVTGNKDLLKMGGTMSLVGGIGGMAVGAATSAGGAAASSAISGTADGAGALLKGVDAAAGDVFSGASLGGDAALSSFSNSASGIATTDAIGNAAGNTSPMDMNNIDMGAPTGQAGQAGQQATMQVGQQAPTADNGMMKAPDVAGAQSPVGVTGPSSPADINYDSWDFQGAKKITDGQTGQSAKSFFDSISSFANNNKTLFDSGMKLAGSAMSGASQSEMWDKKIALENERLRLSSYGSAVAAAPRGILATGAR